MAPSKSLKAQAKTSRRQHSVTTIADVASEAGVSPMTVSRVINGESSVRLKTRARVEAAIAKLNYVPNPSARALAGGRPLHIGILYDDANSPYLSEFLVGALEQTSRLNAQLTVEKTTNTHSAMEIAQLWIEQGFDGGGH